MTEEQKRNIRECLESQGMDPDLMRWTMARIEENEAMRQAKNSKEAERGREIMKFKPNPGTAKMTQVGETKTYLGGDDHGLPIYQEDVDMIKKALPLAKKLLKYMPQETRGNEKPLDYKPLSEMSPQERIDNWLAKEEKERQTLRTLRDTIDEAYNINPEELNMGPDTTENINEVQVDDIPEKAKRSLLRSQGIKKNEKEFEPRETMDDEKEDPTQDVMWYFDPKSEQFKPVIEYETEGLQGKDKQCNRIVSSPGTEKQPLNIKNYCDRFKKKTTNCPDPAYTDECAWYALNRDDNKKNITPGQWDKMTENKITEEMISNATDTTNPFTYSQILTRMHKTHERKNHDYGDAAYQGYKKFGPTYFLVQLHNKLSRLESLTAPGTETQVKDESIDDTLLDLANYAVMYLESRHRND